MLPYFRLDLHATGSSSVSVGMMLGGDPARGDALRDVPRPSCRLPEFFNFKTIVYLWVALGVVKVIHEFGHGLSCKAFGGEVHEMGLLFLVPVAGPLLQRLRRLDPAEQVAADHHQRAGIYVELLIAAIATFVWWNTPSQPFVNNLSLSLMVVCCVSTVVFNANPLMRYDGYYVLADWLEIPNLRDRSNRYLQEPGPGELPGHRGAAGAVHGAVAARSCSSSTRSPATSTAGW